MAKVKDVCHYVRSKNAGPFWITVDLFFDGEENYDRYHKSPEISSAAMASIYGVDVAQVKQYAVDNLWVLKTSYPRGSSQGGIMERDMHGGQKYVRLLDLELTEVE